MRRPLGPQPDKGTGSSRFVAGYTLNCRARSASLPARRKSNRPSLADCKTHETLFACQPKKCRSETDCPKPSSTPVIADSNWIDTWPQPNDPPARDLFTGDDFAGAMVRLTLPRHGGANWSRGMTFNPKDNLPGAINVGFVDGHSELVKLERLWSLDWHKNWVTPAKRPGK